MQPQPDLYVFFGLIASGKSTLAQAWAARHKMHYYNSDVVRKELAGLTSTADRKESFDKGIYSPEFSQKTYQALLERAAALLDRGQDVVLDASYQSREERKRVKAFALAHNARPRFVLCICPEEEMKRRMELRAQDPAAVSDGRWEVYLKQKERFEAPDELQQDQLIRLNTDVPLEEALNKLERIQRG